jgi:hypothetical protein
MTRFEEEWALVPSGARWTAILVALALMSLMASLFLLPVLMEGDLKGVVFVFPLFLLASIGAAPLAVYVLLIGYVYGDARRRAMNQVMWTLLAIFVPSAVGIILYFILRGGTPARKGHAYCASCGTAVRAACPQCRQPVEPGWRNCARCGAALRAAPSGKT